MRRVYQASEIPWCDPVDASMAPAAPIVLTVPNLAMILTGARRFRRPVNVWHRLLELVCVWWVNGLDAHRPVSLDIRLTAQGETLIRNDVKVFIKAIRTHDNLMVEQMLTAMPDLVRAKAKSPPKKDDGQSPLQIAFKVGNFEAAERLLAAGADPDYMEESEINAWRAPVLQDAITATAFNCYTRNKDPDNFETGLRLIREMVASGANPNKTNSFGTNCAMRALADAKQMILHRDVDTSSQGTVAQMRKLFAVLHELGADFDARTEAGTSARELAVNIGLGEYDLLPKPPNAEPESERPRSRTWFEFITGRSS